MKITIEATGGFDRVTQDSGSVLARIWRGTTEDGIPVVCRIPLVQADIERASPEQIEALDKALLDVKVAQQLVSFDYRMVID